jgi:hypothetical protein
MIIIAKILNFVSGLIILVTGVYVDVRFEQVIGEPLRIVVGVLALAYFAMQLYRLIRGAGETSTIRATSVSAKEFRA